MATRRGLRGRIDRMKRQDRIVMHIDMNSYFASVEQQANPFLRGKPIGVSGKRFDPSRADEAQRTIIATASREAKKLGVKTAMSTWEANRILPSLIIVSGDPEKYSEITHRFNAIFHEFTDQVEPFSVDESFLDVTETAGDFLGATMMAQAIRERLRETCGECITASIGIAPNKLVAKVASEVEKPNGLVVVPPERVLSFLEDVKLEDFCGIGRQTKQHLEALGIRTVRDLRACPLAVLVAEFKSYGHWLYNAARGIDHAFVQIEERDPKSVGHSYTIAKDTTSVREIQRVLLGLCEKVAWRLRRDGFLAGQVTVYFRFKNLRGMGEQKRFNEPTADGLELFKIAWSLASKWPPVRLAVPGGHRAVRLVGVSTSALTKNPEQHSLFAEKQKTRRVTQALDAIQTRYGSGSWTRASLIDVEFRARSSGWHYDHEL